MIYTPPASGLRRKTNNAAYSAMLRFTSASKFLDAARELNSVPYWEQRNFLVMMAIELAGKSYLLSNGKNTDEVTAYGHKLKPLIADCRTLGMTIDVDHLDESIEMMHEVWADHSLRYTEPGHTILPGPNTIDAIAAQMVTAANNALKAIYSEDEFKGDTPSQE